MNRNTFHQDRQGRQYAGLFADPRTRTASEAALDFFASGPEVLRRMEESEIFHNRPALAGVVAEVELLPAVHAFLSGTDAHETRSFRRMLGVLARIVMESAGWSTTGEKGRLGVRHARVPVGTTTPGAYRNDMTGGRSVSRWLTSSERYEPPRGHRHRAIWEDRRSEDAVVDPEPDFAELL